MSTEPKRVIWMTDRDVSHCEKGGGGLFEVSSDKWRREEHDVALVRLEAFAELIESAKRTVRYADSEPDGDQVVEVSRANIRDLRNALSRIRANS